MFIHCVCVYVMDANIYYGKKYGHRDHQRRRVLALSLHGPVVVQFDALPNVEYKASEDNQSSGVNNTFPYVRVRGTITVN